MKRTWTFFPFVILVVQFLMAGFGSSSTSIQTDQSALLAMKAHVSSDPYSALADNWSAAAPVCNWYRITCGSRHQRVTAINLSNLALSGNIPPQIGNLSFLISLDLSGNHFDGKLQDELAHLSRLRIMEFSCNSFSGEIPLWLGYLQNLEILSLSGNSLSGLIPSSIGNLSRLESLSLQSNSIHGKIPGEIGNLQNLRSLNMSNNKLTGAFPEEIGNLSNLHWLDIGNNNITGTLPLRVLNISTLLQINMANNSLSGTLRADMCFRLSRLEELNLNGNGFWGQIPRLLDKCSALQILSLEDNRFTGSIPRGIGNLTMLRGLFLGYNNLTGLIPEEIGNLQKLEELNLRYNVLRGQLPAGIFNISALKIIALTYNNLSGILPSSMGYGLPNLEELKLNFNDLTGVIPDSISNSSKLTIISLRLNKFSGPIPSSLGKLQHLDFLNLARNRLTSDPDLSFITSLTKSSRLRYLIVNDNPLNGVLPASIGNLSASLENIYAARCKFKGKIPKEIGNLSNLILLDLSENDLTGTVPLEIQGLRKLQRLAFNAINIKEPFPVILCKLPNLGGLYFNQTQISGPIPECLGNVSSLREIYLDSNRLSSRIPPSLWNLRDLFILNLSSNSFSGPLSPEVGNLKSAAIIDLSSNQITGTIPSTVGGLQSLVSLSLAHNQLQGSIPESISNILSLEFMDLSYNNLNGWIPNSLESLPSLTYFNVSFNHLKGEIPSNGPFKNFGSEYFLSNEGLCGDPRFYVPPCQTPQNKRKVLKIVFIISGILAVMLVISMSYLLIRCWKKAKPPYETDIDTIVEGGRISYYELLHATDGYSERNLLGVGSFGSVYKGTLRDGTVLAVKVFNSQLSDAFRSFQAECDILRNLRHRNLTKVITSCSNPDFKALVMEYMPNGSLEKWLYSENHFLDLMQRLNIMIDVACALEYLHDGSVAPVVHCDLKPSNVLLDEDMVAHVSDFGVAKMLSGEESFVHTQTLATLGYMAPEYGSEGLVSTKADIYSYGILLMETFSRTRPSNHMFSGDFSLKHWVKDSTPNAISNFVDASILRPEDADYSEKVKCITSIIELALNCSAESPKERINMIAVVAALKKIRHQL